MSTVWYDMVPAQHLYETLQEHHYLKINNLNLQYAQTARMTKHMAIDGVILHKASSADYGPTLKKLSACLVNVGKKTCPNRECIGAIVPDSSSKCWRGHGGLIPVTKEECIKTYIQGIEE